MLRPVGGDLTVYLLDTRAESVRHVMSRLAGQGPQPGRVLGQTQDGRTEVTIGDRVIAVRADQTLPPGTTGLEPPTLGNYRTEILLFPASSL